MFRPLSLLILAMTVGLCQAFAQTDPLRTELDNIFSSVNKAVFQQTKNY